MKFQNLNQQNLEDLLNNVTGLAAVADKDQVQSIMAVIAKCTLELGKDLTGATNEIAAFNHSTTELTKVIIRLNKVLVVATVAGACAAIMAAIAAFKC